MSKQHKVTLSLSPQLVADLDYLAERTGVSRSALVSEILLEPIAEMRRLMAMIPPNPTPADVLRLRGSSADVIRERLASLQGIADDLFSKP